MKRFLLALCALASFAHAGTVDLLAGAGTGKPLRSFSFYSECTKAGDATGKKYTCKTTVEPPAPAPDAMPAPPVVSSPPVVDHSKMGPEVDKTLIPAPTAMNAPGPWGSKLAQNVVNIMSPSPEAVTPADIGSFRTTCNFSHFLNDDPIVYPGQPGKSHTHVFFGNMSANADTTVDNIRLGVGSTCAGGLANLTAYWAPAMIDTGIHAPLKPSSFVAYYKSGYDIYPASSIKAPPTGLRMITGDAGNSDPAGAKNTRYMCYGPNGENPGWAASITDAIAKGTCVANADFVMDVNFPQCWDGVNLDSPNHNSHMSGVVQDQSPPFAKHCPTTHPVPIPAIAFNIHYAVPDATAVSRWRLASDMYDVSLPAGLSGHGDYFIGWDEKVKALWMKNCVNAQIDCHADNLGDGSRLY